MKLNTETGEIMLSVDEDADMYRATGRPCAISCCKHKATTIYFNRDNRQGRAVIFLCACCLALKKVERAKWYADRIETLTEGYVEAMRSCK